MNISATELNKHTGTYLYFVMKEPVIIEKTGHPLAVMLSYERYKELELLEDKYWGEKAKKAEKSAEWVNAKESMDFLNGCINSRKTS
jgi:prevent-host-death family protein